jgi:NAD(P)H-dependent FMN reductase
MITIICGTNRFGSNTSQVAREYQQLLNEKGVESVLASLESLDLELGKEAFLKFEQEIVMPASHFIIIVPEYNGSFPGILKMMIDNSNPGSWNHKKALLTGVATGRAGNLRGMDHLADILNYLKVTVHPNRLPISKVDTLLNADGKFIDAGSIRAIHQQLNEFIQWMPTINVLPLKTI